MSNSSESLAIVVYVRDCQAKLETLATRLLELAAELTNQLELVFVDDASTDGSDDVIWEFATRYAQVDHVRNAKQRGMEASLRSGFQLTTGKYVLFCDGTRLFDIEQAVRLWRDRDEAPAANPPLAVVTPAPRGLTTRQWLKKSAYHNIAPDSGIAPGVSMFLRERSQLVAQWSEFEDPNPLPKSRKNGNTGVVRQAPRRPFALRKTDFSVVGPKAESPSRIFRDALDRLQESDSSR